MGRYLKALIALAILAGLAIVILWLIPGPKSDKTFSRPEIGTPIDSLDGVLVYYNGSISNEAGRNVTPDGYNLGLKYQCVEFVKRYYYYHYHHKMPESWGNAVDFFDSTLKDGELNKKRHLLQYHHPSQSKPRKGDILIYSGTLANSFGHVCIVARVEKSYVEIIQQNPGPFSNSRVKYALSNDSNGWRISNERILGWLRMP